MGPRLARRQQRVRPLLAVRLLVVSQEAWHLRVARWSAASSLHAVCYSTISIIGSASHTTVTGGAGPALRPTR